MFARMKSASRIKCRILGGPAAKRSTPIRVVHGREAAAAPCPERERRAVRLSCGYDLGMRMPLEFWRLLKDVAVAEASTTALSAISSEKTPHNPPMEWVWNQKAAITDCQSLTAPSPIRVRRE